MFLRLVFLFALGAALLVACGGQPPTPTPIPTPAPGVFSRDCQYWEYPPLLLSVDGAEVGAVVTYFQCESLYIDSTGSYPSRSPSLVVPGGSHVDLRLEAVTQPTTVEVPLYPGAGVYGTFGQWPGMEAVDVLRPEPSLTFQYLPQQPTGEYTLVVRATWEGPVDVFYAKSFTLE